MRIKMAFIGFRHAHVLDLYRRAQEAQEIEIVGACEMDAGTRQQIQTERGIEISYQDPDVMLADIACDVVAVGEPYGRRGAITSKALSLQKHVISDKPICTSLAQLDEIERLSVQHNRKVGCMLDMRDSAQFLGARTRIQAGEIGEVHAISFGGQHPLLLGKRPSWYFEPGQHGGVINDIAIHALDAIPWITGMKFQTIVAARCWPAFAMPDFPHFQDAGQVMLTLENGCGVLGDVSYFAPDSFGYTFPLYWRTTFWGRKGVLEISAVADAITVAADGERVVRHEPLPPGNPGGYLRAFLHDIVGESANDELTTADVLRAARLALQAQQAADTNISHINTDQAIS